MTPTPMNRMRAMTIPLPGVLHAHRWARRERGSRSMRVVRLDGVDNDAKEVRVGLAMTVYSTAPELLLELLSLTRPSVAQVVV